MSAHRSVNSSIASLDNNNTYNGQDYPNNPNYYVIDENFMDVLYKVVLCGVIPPIAAFGIVGNILALIILVRQKLKRSTTVLLISISIADLLFIGINIINVTQYIIRDFYPELERDIQLKMISPFSTYILPLSARISNLLVTAITLERLIAVTFPLKVKEICSKKVATISIIAISISAAIIQLPIIWLYEIKDITLSDGNVSTVLTYGWLGRHTQLFEIYYIASETLLRFIPIGVIIISNCIIVGVIVVKAKWRRKGSFDVRKLSSDKDELQITKTLLTITFIFIVCLMPSTVPRLAVLFDPNSSHHKYSSNVYFLLSVIGLATETFNSSINFIIYISMSKAYRIEFYRICGKMDKKSLAGNSFQQTEQNSRENLTESISLNSCNELTHM